MRILQHINNMENPVIFDMRGKFMFFPINKNAQTSIVRHMLRDRCILRKNKKKEWEKHFNALTEDQAENCFKFGICRNPYDRFVSAYHYLKAKSKLPKHDNNINTFVKMHFPNGDFIDPHFQKQKPQLFQQDVSVVDHLARLESMNEHWKIISEMIAYDGAMKHKNRTEHAHWSDELNMESMDIIYEHYEEDFHAFGYEKYVK